MRDIIQSSPDYKFTLEIDKLNEKITQHFSYLTQDNKAVDSKNVKELNRMLADWSHMRRNNIFLEDNVKDWCAEGMLQLTYQGDEIDDMFMLLDRQKKCAEIFLNESLVDMLDLYNVAWNFSGAENISPKDRVRRFYENFSSKKLQMSGPPCYSREQLENMQAFENQTNFFGEQCFRYKYHEKLTFKNVRKNWGLFYPVCVVPFISRLFSSGYCLWGLTHCLSFPAGYILTSPKKARRYFSDPRSMYDIGILIPYTLGSMVVEYGIMLTEQLAEHTIPILEANSWWAKVGLLTSLYGIFSCVLQKHMMTSSDAKTKYGSYSKISKILNNPNIEIE